MQASAAEMCGMLVVSHSRVGESESVRALSAEFVRNLLDDSYSTRMMTLVSRLQQRLRLVLRSLL